MYIYLDTVIVQQIIREHSKTTGRVLVFVWILHIIYRRRDRYEVVIYMISIPRFTRMTFIIVLIIISETLYRAEYAYYMLFMLIL